MVSISSLILTDDIETWIPAGMTPHCFLKAFDNVSCLIHLVLSYHLQLLKQFLLCKLVELNLHGEVLPHHLLHLLRHDTLVEVLRHAANL